MEETEGEVNACPKCNTPPETRNWHTYCPTCKLEAPFGETPEECEANWNAMTAKTKTPQSAFDMLTDLIEDPQDDGNYRLNVTGKELRELWKAVEDEKAELTQLRAENEHLKHERNRIAMDVRSELLPKIAQWRDVAGRLATALKIAHSWKVIDRNRVGIGALAVYDALAKLSEKP